jgi:hypothetical protein
MCSDLLDDGVEVEIMWISSHVGLESNEIVDEQARQLALNGAVFDKLLPPVDFQGLARSVLLKKWQGRWDAADTGRFTHFIPGKVSVWPWFENHMKNGKFVSTVSRIMSGHCAARSHFSRFGIVEGVMCVCLGDYETVDHLIWHCGDRKVPSNRCTRCTRCAAWDSCPGFVCLEELSGVEVLSGFPWKSWN